MKDFACNVLLSEKARRRGIINSDVLKKYIDEHINGESDYTHQIYTLLMLELWFRQFIDTEN